MTDRLNRTLLELAELLAVVEMRELRALESEDDVDRFASDELGE